MLVFLTLTVRPCSRLALMTFNIFLRSFPLEVLYHLHNANCCKSVVFTHFLYHVGALFYVHLLVFRVLQYMYDHKPKEHYLVLCSKKMGLVLQLFSKLGTLVKNGKFNRIRNFLAQNFNIDTTVHSSKNLLTFMLR